MKNLIVVFLVFFISCNHKNSDQLELEILNKSIVSFQNKDILNDVYENMKDSNIINKSKTIIIYKLTNHSSSTYYFNVNSNSKFESKIKGLPLKNAELCIYENDKNEIVRINTHRINPNFNGNDCSSKNFKVSKFLGYPMNFDSPYLQEQLNFIIHPNETLYFEWFVNLPYGNEFQNAHLDLDKTKNYYAEISMFSDSINCRKTLSRTSLETIKENRYEVYHGIIKSKNKVPVKFID